MVQPVQPFGLARIGEIVWWGSSHAMGHGDVYAGLLAVLGWTGRTRIEPPVIAREFLADLMDQKRAEVGPGWTSVVSFLPSLEDSSGSGQNPVDGVDGVDGVGGQANLSGRGCLVAGIAVRHADRGGVRMVTCACGAEPGAEPGGGKSPPGEVSAMPCRPRDDGGRGEASSWLDDLARRCSLPWCAEIDGRVGTDGLCDWHRRMGETSRSVPVGQP